MLLQYLYAQPWLALFLQSIFFKPSADPISLWCFNNNDADVTRNIQQKNEATSPQLD
ncbi:hypothetical protein EBME_0602 [bacterium endosymbiont of Mortierella elongata FMR23-6]|nr:hypothetical protein EBME_0602 [bacterium endosymbiont of Mortierella elongata FMR23-6]